VEAISPRDSITHRSSRSSSIGGLSTGTPTFLYFKEAACESK
jgi:hypothetical protein